MERKIAEISLRIYGHAIDLIIILLFPMIFMAMLNASTSGIDSNLSIIQLSISTMLYIAIIIMEGITGQSPGKMMAKTRVFTTSGRRINIIHSLIRNVVRLIDFIGFYLVGLLVMRFSYLRQRIGDHFARTMVIYEGDDPEYDEGNKMPTMTVNYDKKAAKESEDDE